MYSHNQMRYFLGWTSHHRFMRTLDRRVWRWNFARVSLLVFFFFVFFDYFMIFLKVFLSVFLSIFMLFFIVFCVPGCKSRQLVSVFGFSFYEFFFCVFHCFMIDFYVIFDWCSWLQGPGLVHGKITYRCLVAIPLSRVTRSDGSFSKDFLCPNLRENLALQCSRIILRTTWTHWALSHHLKALPWAMTMFMFSKTNLQPWHLPLGIRQEFIPVPSLDLAIQT